MNEIKLELTAEDIEKYKEAYLRKKFDDKAWDLAIELQNKFTQQFVNDFHSRNEKYLTREYKDYLFAELKDEIKLLVDEYCKEKMKKYLKSLVVSHLEAQISSIFAELKEGLLVVNSNQEQEVEEEHHE